jgi:hypothetical protein
MRGWKVMIMRNPLPKSQSPRDAAHCLAEKGDTIDKAKAFWWNGAIQRTAGQLPFFLTG